MLIGYGEWWKALESLIAEFRIRKINIPSEVMTSLRSAKTMISVYKADSSHLEHIMDIENYLLDVESSLINLAKEKVDQTFAQDWLQKLGKSRKEEAKPETRPAQFFSSLPRSAHWIRILPSEDILKQNVKRLAGELKLGCKTQNDGYLLVYGSKENIKEFVKRMAEKCRRTRKK
ncbi:MAG: DUF2096 family protein [Candidatus Bathyarchaeota archaeon]|nr:MAG: DUF2096 family protein [Candidatus Bathyarchaeota archaeon]